MWQLVKILQNRVPRKIAVLTARMLYGVDTVEQYATQNIGVSQSEFYLIVSLSETLRKRAWNEMTQIG